MRVIDAGLLIPSRGDLPPNHFSCAGSDLPSNQSNISESVINAGSLIPRFKVIYPQITCELLARLALRITPYRHRLPRGFRCVTRELTQFLQTAEDLCGKRLVGVAHVGW